jgi:hypothetical protein
MRMADRRNVYAEKLDRIHASIVALEDGTSTSQVQDGVTYTAATDSLAALYRLRDRMAVKAAIQAIEEGAQVYTVLGRQFTKGNLRELYDRDRELTQAAVRESRGGMRARTGVLLG